jgi:hypothetical protein
MSSIAHIPTRTETATTNHFSIGRVSLCLLPLLVLALWMLAFSGLAKAGSTATASSPARVSVAIPASAKGSSIVMLDISIAVVRKPSSGQLGAVVRIKGQGSASAEIGRVSIAEGQENYQFNVGALPAGGSAEVEVAVVDRGGGPAPTGAELAIGRAEIVTR